MVSFDSKQANEFVRLWADICAREGDVDIAKAKWATAVIAWVGSKDFGPFCLRRIGIHSSTSGSLADRAEALSLIRDERVWQAVRWPGVMRVARIADAKKRARACAAFVAEREAGRHVSDDRLREILREHAPAALVPPAPETAKDRQQARMAEAKRADAKAIEQAPRVPDRGDVLAKAIRRLVSGGYAFLADLLTPEERKAAGLPAAKRKASAS